MSIPKETKNKRDKSTILSKNFERLINDKEVRLYTLVNTNGIELNVTNLGLHIISLYTEDLSGNFSDIVLGFDNIESYMNDDGKYFGSIVGQYANRIKNGTFKIGKKEYQLSINDGVNHLHGGEIAYSDVIWKVIHYDSNKIIFQNSFKDGQNGYPGNLNVKVTYLLTDLNELKIFYEATTDKPTIINLTNHSYFNLKGEGVGSIRDHQLMINAEYYLPTDVHKIPLLEKSSVINTPFDFREAKFIGDNLSLTHEQLGIGGGFDHTFIIRAQAEDGLQHAATVTEKVSGRVLEVFTTEPGVQLYTANHLQGEIIGKSGEYYYQYSGFCLETQHYPNSPNTPSFPSTILHENQKYQSCTVYKFSTINSITNEQY